MTLAHKIAVVSTGEICVNVKIEKGQKILVIGRFSRIVYAVKKS